MKKISTTASLTFLSILIFIMGHSIQSTMIDNKYDKVYSTKLSKNSLLNVKLDFLKQKMNTIKTMGASLDSLKQKKESTETITA